MIEAVVMKSYAYSIYLFGAAMLVKLVTRAYVNGEREPKGCETRKRNTPGGMCEWIETCTDRSSIWCPLPQWWVMHRGPPGEGVCNWSRYTLTQYTPSPTPRNSDVFSVCACHPCVEAMLIHTNAGFNNCWRLLLDQSLASGDFSDA